MLGMKFLKVLPIFFALMSGFIGVGFAGRDGAPNDRLYWAATFGELEEFNEALDEKADIYCQHDTMQFTVLHAAASHGREDMVERIFDLLGDSINRLVFMKDGHGYTALHAAVAHNYSNVVAKILSNKNIDVPNLLMEQDKTTKRSALHCATFNGNIKIFTQLLEAMPTSKAKEELLLLGDNRKQTVFHVAVFNGFSKIVEKIRSYLNEDLFLSLANSYLEYETPLHCALRIKDPRRRVCMVRLLCGIQGINKTVGDSFGRDPIYYADSTDEELRKLLTQDQ
jgi:ankyrin repeat protein